LKLGKHGKEKTTDIVRAAVAVKLGTLNLVRALELFKLKCYKSQLWSKPEKSTFTQGQAPGLTCKH
jgi:hypothetical protein